MTDDVRNTPPHEQGAMIERVARALCRFTYATRDEMEPTSPSGVLWHRLIPEAEVALKEMQSEIASTPATVSDEELRESFEKWLRATFPGSHNGMTRYGRGDMLWAFKAGCATPSASAPFIGSPSAELGTSPLPMLMFCPRCSKQHIDEPKGDWTNPPHATHTCQHCGLLWRPSNHNTTGVAFVKAAEEKHVERIAASFPHSATASLMPPDDHTNDPEPLG